MDKKYSVPALEKAHAVLQLIVTHPHKYRLIDLSQLLDIHKSTMYSILQTMESLEWVQRDANDTYAIGSTVGMWGISYAQDNDMISSFYHEAAITRDRLQETIQLACLEGNEALYLGKVEAQTLVRLRSVPGMKFPAHVTALGKVMLSFLEGSELDLLYPSDKLVTSTPHSIKTKTGLVHQLHAIRSVGFALDEQEGIIGFSCVAAPILSREGKAIAAVSCSMPQYIWEQKREWATKEICDLASRLSSF